LHDLVIYNPQDDKTADVVYTAQDFLGVVEAIFVHSSKPVKADEALDIWWRTFAIPHQPSHIFKVRRGIPLPS